MIDYSGRERRRYIRVNTTIIVKLDGFDDIIYSNKAVSKNISQGGLLFEYNKDYNLGIVLCVEVRLPELGKRIVCYGKVVRVENRKEDKSYGIAVSFINIAEADVESLKRYVKIKLKINPNVLSEA